MEWWIWALVGLLLLAIEFASASVNVGLFAIGAFVVAMLVAFGVELPLWGELLIFTGVSVLSLIFIRPVIIRKLKLHEPNVVDSLVGEEALALEDMGVGSRGRAELRGATWSALNVGETVLIKGQRCVVTAVDELVIQIRAS
jgi:membrane protein implicated in regulation of membrane protease activity